MPRFFHLLTVVMIIGLPTLSSLADTINVPAEHANIQDAINAAANGDVIIVQPGSYSENLNMSGKNITLQSADPTSATIVSATIIDGGATGSVITFAGTESSDCVVAGFTIQNGLAAQGGGINGNGCQAVITRNLIQNNTADTGGGIYACYGLISHNTITSNSAMSGGGISTSFNGVIEFNTISYNQLTGIYGQGAGVSVCVNVLFRNNIVVHNVLNTSNGAGAGLDNCSGSFYNNIIAFNSIASNGSGGGLFAVTGTLQNCVVYGNSAPFTAAINSYRLHIINSVIWGNTTTTGSDYDFDGTLFYCAADSWTGPTEGAVLGDPMFADAPNGDFSLLPGSPCINAGNENYLMHGFQQDILGNCRVTSGTQVDIGVVESDSSPDTDGDLVADIHEAAIGGNALLADTDSDGINDGIEYRRGRAVDINEPLTGLTVTTGTIELQRGIFLAAPNEVVTVHPGVYSENINLIDKDFVLEGTDPDDWDVVRSTIIDGQGRFTTVKLSDLHTPSSQLRGLTIYNGGNVQGGGGILGSLSDTVVDKCVITSNTAINSGGGIYSVSSAVTDSILEFNTAGQWGGAMHSSTANRSILRYNVASGQGGGANASTLFNTLVYDNSAPEGGGLSQSAIWNCVVYANTASVQGGGSFNTGTTHNSIIWNNSAPLDAQIHGTDLPSWQYNCIQDWAGGGTGNFSDAPLFVNPAGWDFHIQPASPCVDAGRGYGFSSPADFDIDGDARGQDYPSVSGGDGSNYDVGLDELPVTLAVWDWSRYN